MRFGFRSQLQKECNQIFPLLHLVSGYVDVLLARPTRHAIMFTCMTARIYTYPLKDEELTMCGELSSQ